MFSYKSYRSGDFNYVLLSPEHNNENDRPWSTLQPRRSPAKSKRRLQNFSEPPFRPHTVQIWKVNEHEINKSNALDTHLVVDNKEKSPSPEIDPLSNATEPRQSKTKSFTDSVARAELRKRNSVRFTQSTYLLKTLNSLQLQMLMLAIVLTDLVLAFYPDVTVIVTFIILFAYTVEIVIRGLHYHYWLNVLNILDVLIVVGSIIFQILSVVDNIQIDDEDSLDDVALYFRFLRTVYKLILVVKRLPKGFRGMVRNNKQGFHDEEWDLDLCYISDRIISMGLPSTGLESLYRNPIDEVRRFLDQFHYGKYIVFDLCEERSYDARHFHGRVSEYKFQDHSIPSLGQLFRFCREASDWLEQDPENVVCVHCRGGKGRTGTVVTCLLRQRYYDTNIAQLHDHFARMRTNEYLGNKYQGVRNPSQIRYTKYFEKLLSDPTAYIKVLNPVSMMIAWIKFGPVYNGRRSQWGIRLIQLDDSVDADEPKVKEFGVSMRVKDLEEENMHQMCIIGDHSDVYSGNIGIEFYKKSKDKKVGVLWIHSLMCKHDRNSFGSEGTLKYVKKDIDRMCKKREKFVGFEVEIRCNFLATPKQSRHNSIASHQSHQEMIKLPTNSPSQLPLESFEESGYDLLLPITHRSMTGSNSSPANCAYGLREHVSSPIVSSHFFLI